MLVKIIIHPTAVSSATGRVSVSGRRLVSHPRRFFSSNELEGGCRVLNTVWECPYSVAEDTFESLAVSQFRVRILRRSIWRPITSVRRAKAVSIRRLLQMQPDAIRSRPRISQDLCEPKKKKERTWQKSSCEGKTSGDVMRKRSKS